MLSSSGALVLAMAGTAFAQSESIVTLTLPSLVESTIHASVITTLTEIDATSYSIGCAKQTGAETECGIPPNFRLLDGPSTLRWQNELGPSNTADFSCKVVSSTATCTGTVVYEAEPGSPSETDIMTTIISDFAGLTKAVTITAGLAESTDTPVESEPGANESDAQPTSSSTAGVPRVTQQAVLAGVAALAGGAMML